ncbi:MAG TPA: hypothetical protein VFA71_15180 [Terriglobales bacterium]|nr:hypothetical protein [Terriglobales bacterium]
MSDSGIGNDYKFTGKERDPETGCDYFRSTLILQPPSGAFILQDWVAKPTAVTPTSGIRRV